jgi:hypothetical protein
MPIMIMTQLLTYWCLLTLTMHLLHLAVTCLSHAVANLRDEAATALTIPQHLMLLTYPSERCICVLLLPHAVAKLRVEAAAALAQLLPATAQLAAAREALAAQMQGAAQDVTQHKGRLRHIEEQVSRDAQ